MNDAPPNAPSAPSSPWVRLHRRGVIVGFKRSLGNTELFSRDGYGWTGRPIDFDHAIRETGLRDSASRRVFHGDVVTLRLEPSSPLRQAVVLLDASRSVFLADPQTGDKAPLPQGTRPHITDVHASIFDHSLSSVGCISSLRRFGVDHARDHREGAMMALGILGGVLLFGALQWSLGGSVGPLVGMLGATLGCLAFTLGKRRRSAGWLTRARTLRLVPWTALYLGLGALGLRIISALSSNSAPVDSTLAVSALGLGILGGLVGLVLPMVVADAIGFSPEG